jgi:hypothetical protein
LSLTRWQELTAALPPDMCAFGRFIANFPPRRAEPITIARALPCSRVSLTAASEWAQHVELAEFLKLSYNRAMHKHLRRLDRIWLDSPIYFITMCTKDRCAVLARDEVSEILLRNGAPRISAMAGPLADM